MMPQNTRDPDNLPVARAISPLSELHPEVRDEPEGERLYSALLKHWRVFVAVAGGFVLLITGVSAILPKSYTTTTRLLSGRSDDNITTNQTATNLPVLNALVLQSGVQSAETLAALAQQRSIAADVIAKLNLHVSPEQLLSRTSVKPIVNTALLDLSVRWNTPKGAADITNAFANAFISGERDFVRSQAVAALGFLSAELPNAQAKMRESASRLAAFQSQNGFMNATLHEQDVVSRVATTDQQIDQLQVDESEATALLKSVNSQLASVSSTIDSARQVGTNPVSTDVNTKLAEVNAQLAEAEQKYTPAHPAVIALRQQQAALKSQVAALPANIVNQTTVAPNPVYQTLQQQAAIYQSRIQGDQSKEATLGQLRNVYAGQVSMLPKQAIQFATINEEATRAANVYNALVEKYNDALVAKTTAISDLVVAQPASASAATVSPNVPLNAAISLIVGLLLALAVVYVLDLLDRKAEGKRVAAFLGLPVVARIPALTRRKPGALPWLQSMMAEAFLNLCVAARLTDKRVRSLAVLSVNRGDGKSTVAYRLAETLSVLQPGVLLIDADMRRPTVHEKANCKNDRTLADVLKGTLSLDQAVWHVGPGFDVLPSKPDTPDPVVLLQSSFDSLLASAEQRYNTIIVDTPAFPAVSDAMVVSTMVDQSLLVVGANTWDEAKIRDAVAQLALSGVNNLFGVVVNGAIVDVGDYQGYYDRPLPALPAHAR